MRKTLSTLVLLCTAASTLFADANYLIRKNCWGGLSWRHKTYANVTKKGSAAHYWATGSGTNNSCSPTRTDKYGYYAPILPGVTVADAHAVTNAGTYANTHINPGLSSIFSAGGNTDMIAAEYSYAPMFEAPEQDPYEGMEGIVSNISTQQIDFDELTHSIVISGINARVGVDDPDMENAYATFKIWILDATDVNDENNAKVITTFQAFVRNGQLILEGNMSANDFTAQNNKAIYTLTGLTRTISIPQNISLDDVIVKVGADLGNLGDGINPEYSLNFNQQKYAGANKEIHDNARFQIDILGNPASGNLNFVVANGKRKYTSATIDVYSCDGKLVKHVYDGELANLSKDFCIDISSLPTGNYYLSTVTDTKEKFTRKFIKQ